MAVTVLFKDEDADEETGAPIGPVTVIDWEKYEADPEVAKRRADKPLREGVPAWANLVGLPFGYEPQGVTALGWKSYAEARRIARKYGVEVEQS